MPLEEFVHQFAMSPRWVGVVWIWRKKNKVCNSHRKPLSGFKKQSFSKIQGVLAVNQVDPKLIGRHYWEWN
jgi:hypothetical protein